MSEPNGFAALPGVRKDFRGQGYVKYWHSGRSEAQEPRRKKGGIMLVSWSQATLHSSMLPLLPLTDINTRNQLNLLGCYPRDFGGGGNQSIWRQGKRKGQSAMKESKLQLQLVVMFCLCLQTQDNVVFLGFHRRHIYNSRTFSIFLFSYDGDMKTYFPLRLLMRNNETAQNRHIPRKARFRSNFGIPSCCRLVKNPLRPFNWSQLEVTVNGIPLLFYGGHRSFVLQRETAKAVRYIHILRSIWAKFSSKKPYLALKKVPRNPSRLLKKIFFTRNLK